MDNFEAPKTDAVVIEIPEGWTAPTMDSGSMGDATCRVTKRFSTFWTREMNVLRWRWDWAKIIKVVNSKSVESFETVVEVTLCGDCHTMPAGFNIERAVDKRAPFRRTAADKIDNDPSVRVRSVAMSLQTRLCQEVGKDEAISTKA